jgi:hypothetical protein
MKKLNLNDYGFISVINPSTKLSERYAILANGDIHYKLIIKKLGDLELEEQAYTFRKSFNSIKLLATTLYNSWIAQNANTTQTMSQAETIVMNDLTALVRGKSIYRMNSKTNKSSVKINYDELGEDYYLEFHEDTIKQFTPEVEENKFIQSFYEQIENGDILLYYLNEFRHVRPIPTIILAGTGGGGKSTPINHFTSYKRNWCSNFFKDKFTGDLGETSLIVEEESSSDSSGTLTLNYWKKLQTDKLHALRRMKTDQFMAAGQVTILVSANKTTDTSHFLQLLNRKGEDINSILRRCSTFSVTDQNAQYLLQPHPFQTGEVMGQYMNEVNKGETTTALDRHLNYLESIKYFDAPRFKRTTPLYLLCHSPNVDICTRLSNVSANFLEALASVFAKQDKITIDMPEKKDIFEFETKEERCPSKLVFALWELASNKKPSQSNIRKHFQDLTDNCFKFYRSTGINRVKLTDREKFNLICKEHFKGVEEEGDK